MAAPDYRPRNSTYEINDSAPAPVSSNVKDVAPAFVPPVDGVAARGEPPPPQQSSRAQTPATLPVQPAMAPAPYTSPLPIRPVPAPAIQPVAPAPAPLPIQPARLVALQFITTPALAPLPIHPSAQTQAMPPPYYANQNNGAFQQPYPYPAQHANYTQPTKGATADYRLTFKAGYSFCSTWKGILETAARAAVIVSE